MPVEVPLNNIGIAVQRYPTMEACQAAIPGTETVEKDVSLLGVWARENLFPANNSDLQRASRVTITNAKATSNDAPMGDSATFCRMTCIGLVAPNGDPDRVCAGAVVWAAVHHGMHMGGHGTLGQYYVFPYVVKPGECCGPVQKTLNKFFLDTPLMPSALQAYNNTNAGIGFAERSKFGFGRPVPSMYCYQTRHPATYFRVGMQLNDTNKGRSFIVPTPLPIRIEPNNVGTFKNTVPASYRRNEM